MKDAKQLAAEMRGIWDRADREGRDLTLSERHEVEDLVAKTESQHRTEQQIKSSGLDEFFKNGWGGGGSGSGPGDVFVNSQGYKQIKSPDARPQQWSSGLVEVSTAPFQTKGTLLETGAGGPGGGLVPPYYQPGITSKLFEPLGVSDLFGSSNTTASQVRYVNEGTATSGAAGVPEAGVKPESTLAYSEVTEPVKKIATLLGISDEMLEDAPSIQSYLNERLGLFVRIEEERQLLRGAGTNELIGVMSRTGGQQINVYTKLAGDDNAVALLKVLNNTRGSSYLEPDAIIMHPSNWLSTRLLRDGTGGTVGQFYGGGPFAGPYGGPAPQTNAFTDTLWNKRVVLSTVVGAGTALVGSFGQGAHIWRRGGVSVEASNSHSDWFQKDLTAIRAESRLALGLYRPSSFTEVRGMA